MSPYEIDLANVGYLLLALLGVGLCLALLLLGLVFWRVRKIHLPADADFLTALQATPFLVVVVLDLLDFSLDFLSKTIGVGATPGGDSLRRVYPWYAGDSDYDDCVAGGSYLQAATRRAFRRFGFSNNRYKQGEMTMPIIRREDAGASTAQFSVGVNVVLVGSKKLSSEEQEALLAVDRVRILIADANDPENILVDTEVPAREFSTGSVGYGLNLRGAQFKKQSA
jgi:hypothetical protein